MQARGAFGHRDRFCTVFLVTFRRFSHLRDGKQPRTGVQEFSVCVLSERVQRIGARHQRRLRGESLADASSLYILLAIGDGLVAQIPSLLLAIGTAIIVTRVSSSQAMAEHIGSEIGISQAWYPVAAVIGIIGMVPGMPTALFLTFSAVSAAIGYYLSRARRDEEEYGDATDELTFDEE
ncbi:MAG: hypothetical protein HON70_41360, partial [Lentisphaerae bacterium]|nr:hypothetical protein [Lentisphaerota bacterium]